MGLLEDALRRLDVAVGRLELAVEESGPDDGADADLAALRDERDVLADEVRTLRARAAEDARLRGEAARAVRDALHDLRGAVGVRHEGVRRNA